MADMTSWQGDWQQRVLDRVRQLGFGSMLAFARARPCVSDLQLADELGAQDVNAVQVMGLIGAEAETEGQFDWFLRDALVRAFARHLPGGWIVESSENAPSRMALIATIEDHGFAKKILEHLGLPTRRPPRPSAWTRQPSLLRMQSGNLRDGIDPPSLFE